MHGAAAWTVAARTSGASVRGSDGALSPQATSANGNAQMTAEVEQGGAKA